MQARPREPSRPGGRARLARAQLEATSSRSLLANMQGVAGAIYKLHRPAAADGIHGSSPLLQKPAAQRALLPLLRLAVLQALRLAVLHAVAHLARHAAPQCLRLAAGLRRLPRARFGCEHQVGVLRARNTGQETTRAVKAPRPGLETHGDGHCNTIKLRNRKLRRENTEHWMRWTKLWKKTRSSWAVDAAGRRQRRAPPRNHTAANAHSSQRLRPARRAWAPCRPWRALQLRGPVAAPRFSSPLSAPPPRGGCT